MYLRLADLPQIERAHDTPVALAARDAALLAWLAIEGPTPRARICALLWPDGSDVQARTALRQRLFRLKKALGRDIACGAAVLALAPGVRHDLAEAVDLLGGLGLPDAPELDTWLRDQRERRRGEEQEGLRAQAQALEEAGEVDVALPVALALLRVQPLSEAAHRRVMRLHYLGGDRAAALAAFDACEQMLKHELSARPSAETLALLATLEQAGAAPAQPNSSALPAAVLRPPVMVGRARELRALEQGWRRGQVAVVIGEAGMGKSRLLAEFVSGRAGVVRATGRPGDAGVPFATLVRLLRALCAFGATPSIGVEARHELARVMPELAEAGAVFSAGSMHLLQHAIGEWLAQTPGLAGLVLDDLHFADDASVEMLQSLLADAAPGSPRWVLAFRGAEATGPVRALRDSLAESARLAIVEVAPLDEGALALLVDQLAMGWSGAVVAGPLRQRTGGNPLFLLETLKEAWIEPTAGWPRPESVERLLDRRVARLGAPALALARVAAIAGVDFDIALAAKVLETTALQLADSLNELATAQVLCDTHFMHDLVFDAVLRSVPPAIARHVHAQVAAWLEARAGEPARIAGHWLAADNPARAAPWLSHAARKAVQMMRNVEALAFLEQKARTEAGSGLPRQAFASQVDAVSLSLDVDRDEQRGNARCDLLARWAADPAEHCEAAFMRASLVFRRSEDRAYMHLQEVLRQATAVAQTRLAMECRVMLTLSALRAGRPAEALQHAQACQDWIEAHGGAVRRGELHTYLAMLHARAGTVDDALEHHAHAIRIAREYGVAHHEASVLDHLSTTLLMAGRTDEALAATEEALRIAQRHQEAPANTAVLQLQLGRTFLRSGRYRGALEAMDRADALRGGYGLDLGREVALHRGECWAELGQWARVQAIVAAAAAGPLSIGQRVGMARLAGALDRAAGRAAGPGLMQLLDTLPDDQWHGRALLQLDLAPLLPPVQALERLDALRRQMGARGFDGYVATTHLRSAEVALAIDPQRAHAHALQALALALEQRRDLVGAYRGELFVHAVRALAAAGDAERAAAVLRQGRAWLLATAAEQVPAEFRDGFLHRNPTNASLLALGMTHS